MLSHQLKQYRIDGEKSIIQNPTEAQRTSCVFLQGREMDTRTTVYKRTDETYLLRSKASRDDTNTPMTSTRKRGDAAGL
ncbi:hypothetical protein HPB49_019943 [Dermacentor silvarum]|uniref:Uncharacterized protein n=1 Tax=Dermacentor silvarum TaxID=543639 RepID=A0ACB8CMK5_DERSI|nr:hypothetical protein HPB49_019943 [Dermacentor silvarum]